MVDVETSGFSPRTHRVIEIAIVLLDAAGRYQDEWSTLVNPLGDVGPTWVHGIRPRDVVDAPTFDDIAPQVMAQLAGRTFVAHNASFDLRFVSAELERAGWPLPETLPSLCTMRWSRKFVRGASQKLVDCCAAAGIDLLDAHFALGDARATAELLAHYLGCSGGLAPWGPVIAQCDAYPWPLVMADDVAASLACCVPRALGARV